MSQVHYLRAASVGSLLLVLQAGCAGAPAGDDPPIAAVTSANQAGDDPCPDGQEAGEPGLCVDCAAGTFSVGGAACTPCPQGTYSDASGSPGCVPCGDGMSTATVASTSAACEACAAGETSNAASSYLCVSSPAVRLVGRWDTRSAAGPRTAYPAARAIARFSGTEASVTMANTTGFSGGPARYDVLVDCVLLPGHLETQTGTHTYALASGLAPGVHEVEIYKRTEGNLGLTTFMGFTFGPGGELLAPPPAPPRRIEFIADSTIDGYGVEGAGPNCPAGTLEASHSPRAGVAGLIASDLDADAIMVAYSGKGLYQNSYRPDTATMGIIYPRTLPDDASSVWDFIRARAGW